MVPVEVNENLFINEIQRQKKRDLCCHIAIFLLGITSFFMSGYYLGHTRCDCDECMLGSNSQ